MLRGGASVEHKTEFLRESSIMADLDHPNVCCLVGVCMQQRPWLAVLEFMQYGDLREVLHAFVQKKQQLRNSERLTICVQVNDVF